MAITFDLTAHDAQFHPDGYKPGVSKCKFRDDMKKYENVDDLSQTQNIVDALEDAELLEDMIDAALDENTKKQLQEQLKGTTDILDKILGKGGSEMQPAAAFGPNAPIPYNVKDFPDVKDAKWQEALANYGDSSYGWQSVGSGSTNPHKITFDGTIYFVKQAGNNPTYDKSAARNEANANNFLRLAGLNAPESMYLKADNGERFCISTECDLKGGNLASHLSDKGIADQVKEAYPIMSLLYNMDVMQNADNAYVDGNGNALFLDNGSTFGFSAQGERNKRLNFDDRSDPINGNPDFIALANYKDNNSKSGARWRKAIMGSENKDVDMETALKEAAKYDMGALVREADKQGLLKQLPQKGKDALMNYADELDKLSAKYKPVKQPNQPNSQSSAQPSQKQSSVNQKQTERCWKYSGQTKTLGNIQLKQICANRDIKHPNGTIIPKDTIGGWIESDDNLQGNAFVANDACVYGNAVVSDNAYVIGNAKVYGDAKVSGNAVLYGNAVVSDNTAVYGTAWVGDNAAVYGDAKVYGNAEVYDNATVYDNAKVYDQAVVSGDAQVYGDAAVYGSALMYGNARVQCDAKVYGNAEVYDDAMVREKAEVYGQAKISGETLIGDNAKVYGNAKVSDRAAVNGNTRVYGDAKVYGDAHVCGHAWVGDNALVRDNALIYGNARVYGDAQVYDRASVFVKAQVYGNAKVSGDAKVYGNAEVGQGAVLIQGSYNSGKIPSNAQPPTQTKSVSAPAPASNHASMTPQSSFAQWDKDHKKYFTQYFRDANNDSFVKNAGFEMRVTPKEFKNAARQYLYQKGYSSANGGSIPKLDQNLYADIMNHLASNGGTVSIQDFHVGDNVDSPMGPGKVYAIYDNVNLVMVQPYRSNKLYKFSPSYYSGVMARPLSQLVNQNTTSAQSNASSSGQNTQASSNGNSPAFARLSKMMASRKLTAAQRAGYQAMLNRYGNMPSSLPTGIVAELVNTNNQPTTTVAPTSTATVSAPPTQTPPSQPSANPIQTSSVKNPAVKRLMTLMNNPNIPTNKKSAYQAMINRFNGAAI